MRVGVDPAGQDCEVSEIEVNGGGLWIEGNNFRTFDHNAGVVKDVAFAVEESADGKDGAVGLGDRNLCGKCQNQGEESYVLHLAQKVSQRYNGCKTATVVAPDRRDSARPFYVCCGVC